MSEPIDTGTLREFVAGKFDALDASPYGAVTCYRIWLGLTADRLLEVGALADALAAAVDRFTVDPERSHRDAGLDYEAMIEAARAYKEARGL